MDTFVAVIAFIAIIFFMIINLSIYHKIFKVVYFNLGKGCFSELFFSWLIAMFEVGILIAVGKFVLGILFKILGFAGIFLAVALAVYVVWKIIQMVTGKVNAKETNNTDDNVTQTNQVMDDIKESEDESAEVNLKSSQESKDDQDAQNDPPGVVCTACGKVVNENAKFCNFCGNEVVKVDTTICVNCKKPVSPNANFCNYCGERIAR